MKIFYLFILIAVAMEHCKGNGMKYLLVEIDDGKGKFFCCIIEIVLIDLIYQISFLYHKNIVQIFQF